jgi:hypothetical protein
MDLDGMRDEMKELARRAKERMGVPYEATLMIREDGKASISLGAEARFQGPRHYQQVGTDLRLAVDAAHAWIDAQTPHILQREAAEQMEGIARRIEMAGDATGAEMIRRTARQFGSEVGA